MKPASYRLSSVTRHNKRVVFLSFPVPLSQSHGVDPFFRRFRRFLESCLRLASAHSTIVNHNWLRMALRVEYGTNWNQIIGSIQIPRSTIATSGGKRITTATGTTMPKINPAATTRIPGPSLQEISCEQHIFVDTAAQQYNKRTFSLFGQLPHCVPIPMVISIRKGKFNIRIQRFKIVVQANFVPHFSEYVFR